MCRSQVVLDTRAVQQPQRRSGHIGTFEGKRGLGVGGVCTTKGRMAVVQSGAPTRIPGELHILFLHDAK